MVFYRTLDNGIRVIGQKMPEFRSVSIGVWVRTGSVRELPEEAGASHFIEHMVFKGTKTRSAVDIAAEMDGVGASINAFTSKECTCFYVKLLDENVELGVDILADIVMNSVFDEEEMEKEKGVVIEEILMMMDSPEDLAHETLADIYYEGDPLAKPILGSQESVQAFTRKSLFAYKDKYYGPDNIVISCAGNIDEERICSLIEEKFSLHKGDKTGEPPKNKTKGGKRFKAIERDVEQVHICLGMPGFAIDTKEQYPLLVLNNALGGSMSSRLFQKIREQRGMAYSVYSYPVTFSTTGCFGLYAGTGEKQAANVVELMIEELDNVLKKGLTKEEFERSKQQLKGNFLLGQESTSGRMNSLGKSLLLLGKIYSEEERIAQIEAITMQDVQDILPTVFSLENTCMAVVGRVGHQKDKLERLLS